VARSSSFAGAAIMEIGTAAGTVAQQHDSVALVLRALFINAAPKVASTTAIETVLIEVAAA
jgi:hypothetical protein